MKKIVIFHNGMLDNDGRVLRSIELLINIYESVEVVCKQGKNIPGICVTTYNHQLFKIPFFGNIFWALYVSFKYWGKVKAAYFHDYLCLFALNILSFDKRITTIIYDAHELLLKDSSGFSEYKKYWQYLEKKAIKKIHLLIVANQLRANEMIKFYGYMKKVLVIDNYYEGMGVTNSKVVELNNPVFLYQGSLAKDRCLDKIIYFLSRVQFNYKFKIIGTGDQIEELKELSKRLSQDKNIEFLGFMPKDKLYVEMSKCDIGIVSYQMKGLNTLFCAPNKIYEYTAFGLPVISTPQHTLKQTLLKNNIGFSFNESDYFSDSWDDSLQKLSDLLANYALISSNAFCYSKKNNWYEIKGRIVFELSQSL